MVQKTVAEMSAKDILSPSLARGGESVNELRNMLVVKIGEKIGPHPSANVCAYASRARSISLTRKTWLP